MLNPKTLENYLKHLYLAQAFDYRAQQLQKVGIIGTFPSSAGQEHFFLSLAMNINADDWYCPYYRDQAALIFRGMPISALFQYWAGDERGNQHIPAHTMPINVPIGSQVSHATGIAMALRDLGSICVVTLGDGATSKGEVYESINFASIHKLPILFAVNNNNYAISTHINQHSSNSSIADKFNGIIHTQKIITESPIEFFSQTKAAVDYVRDHNAPLLLEAITERIDPHTTNDDATLYRPSTELMEIKAKSPINLLGKELLKENLFTESQLNQIAIDAQTHVAKQLSIFTETPQQQFADLSQYLFEEGEQS